jgi:hypothetical protein
MYFLKSYSYQDPCIFLHLFGIQYTCYICRLVFHFQGSIGPVTLVVSSNAVLFKDINLDIIVLSSLIKSNYVVVLLSVL